MNRISNMARVLIVTVCVVAGPSGCFGPSDTDRIEQIRDDLNLLIESKDSGAILRHMPEDLSRVRISTGSGRNAIAPETLEDVEDALDEVRDIFSADSIDVTQQNIEVDGSKAKLNLTYRISSEGWEKLLPVRVDLERESNDWVLRGLHVFD